MAEQFRRRPAKPQRLVQFQHGIPFNRDIGVDRHTSVFQTEIERALLSCPSTFPSESGLPAETPHGRSNGRVSYSVRLGFFSRREHRCRSELHRPGCGGSTPPSCRVRVVNFDSEVPALNRRELGANPRQPTISASVVKFIIILRFERRVCRWESCRMHQFIGALAQQKRRPAQDGKVEGANPSRATNLPT